jgi:hypothetical protein
MIVRNLQGAFPERTSESMIACLPVGRAIMPYRIGLEQNVVV